MAGKVEQDKVNTLNKEEMQKALNEYVDSMFAKDISDKDENDLSKASDCDDKEVEKASVKKAEKLDEKKKKPDPDDEDEEGEDEEDGEESQKDLYKKGFMDAIQRMKDKMAKKSMEATKIESNEDDNSILKKSISALSEKISSLTDTVRKLSTLPAARRRSVRSVDIIQKSGSEAEDGDIDIGAEKKERLANFMKSKAARYKIADLMFEEGLVKSKGINSRHIAEYEATGVISDVRVQNLVKSLVREHQSQGLI